MNRLAAAQSNYDSDLPDDLRTDDEIEADAEAWRIEREQAEYLRIVLARPRDNAAWDRVTAARLNKTDDRKSADRSSAH